MYYTYTFNYENDEIPYAVWDGEIKYCNTQIGNCIKVKIDIDDNIDFEAGIIGCGFDTDNIKDYSSLLRFLEEHYDEIEEDDDDEGFTYSNKDCIDELIEICKAKVVVNNES